MRSAEHILVSPRFVIERGVAARACSMELWATDPRRYHLRQAARAVAGARRQLLHAEYVRSSPGARGGLGARYAAVISSAVNWLTLANEERLNARLYARAR